MREAEVFKTEDGKQVAVEGFDLKAFVKKNKWKIAGGVAAIGGLIFAGKKLGKKLDDRKLLNKAFTDAVLGSNMSSDHKDLPIPADFSLARIDELWMEGDDVLGIMDDIPIASLGNFGKELKEKIPELKDKDFAHLACVGFTKYNIDGPLVEGGLTPVTIVVEDSLEKTLEAISKIEKAKKEA